MCHIWKIYITWRTNNFKWLSNNKNSCMDIIHSHDGPIDLNWADYKYLTGMASQSMCSWLLKHLCWVSCHVKERKIHHYLKKIIKILLHFSNYKSVRLNTLNLSQLISANWVQKQIIIHLSLNQIWRNFQKCKKRKKSL